MKNALYAVDHFVDNIPVGAKVFYYPNGNKDVSTVPRVGFVSRVFTRCVADLSVLPSQDGAVEYVLHVPHIGDPRVFDHTGNLSALARSSGCWEFHPEAIALMEWMGETTSPKKKERATVASKE